MPLTNAPLATLVLNTYTLGTVQQLADAIDEICSPADAYGFASTGIYLFWDVESHEVLYIGLAIDFGLRFKQHNALVPCPVGACKREQVAAHLAARGQLGYTVFAQSPLGQAFCVGGDDVQAAQLEWITEEFGYLDIEDAKCAINAPLVRGLRWVEGALIRGFMHANGRLPLWNRNGGADVAFDDNDLNRARELLKAAALLKSHCIHLISHCSMVELAASATHTAFEIFLHGVRLALRANGKTFTETCEVMPGQEYWTRIKAQKYLSKLPEL